MSLNYLIYVQYMMNINLVLGLIFFNTWFTDFFSKYSGRRREKNKNKNYYFFYYYLI